MLQYFLQMERRKRVKKNNRQRHLCITGMRMAKMRFVGNRDHGQHFVNCVFEVARLACVSKRLITQNMHLNVKSWAVIETHRYCTELIADTTR